MARVKYITAHRKYNYHVFFFFFLLFQKEFPVKLAEICWKHLFSSHNQTFLLSSKSIELFHLILRNFSLSVYLSLKTRKFVYKLEGFFSIFESTRKKSAAVTVKLILVTVKHLAGNE